MSNYLPLVQLIKYDYPMIKLSEYKKGSFVIILYTTLGMEHAKWMVKYNVISTFN